MLYTCQLLHFSAWRFVFTFRMALGELLTICNHNSILRRSAIGAIHGSLAIVDDSTSRRFRNFPMLSVDVVLDLFDSLLSALSVQAL